MIRVVETKCQLSSGAALPRRLRNVLLLGVVLTLALVLFGRFLTPTSSYLSTGAGLTIAIGYGVLAFFAPKRLHQQHPDILWLATVFGVACGFVFASEILLEYILLPANNSTYGLVEFGLVLLLYFGSGFAATLRTLSVRNAVLTSVATAFIGSLTWAIFVLGVFYCFHGSDRQLLVLRAEGDFEDFTRSGSTDFNAFIMEDFMGATFFHLLLGPVVAAGLGALGGLVGKLAARFVSARGVQEYPTAN